MKRLLILALAAGAAAIAWFQASARPVPLAQLLPSGALIYLEARDFSQLLSEWDASTVKQDWLKSANYDQFARSNLFLKLNVFYQAYGTAAGFMPDMASLRTLAGGESALALYDLRNVQFAYITRIAEAKAAQSRLWLGRASFETRQAGGVTFYIKRSGDVELAFAVTNGYLLVSTGEERMAGMLGLLNGKDTPSVAGETWFRNSTGTAGAPGELRLAMNLETLAGNTYFRSYWVQRNVSEVRRFVSGVADIHRTANEIQEQRLFLKRAGLQEDLPPADTIAAASTLLQMAPDDAGLSRLWAAPRPEEATALIESHILNPQPSNETRPLYAPAEDQNGGAGSEADLETRIDEPPLPKIGEIGSGALQKLLSGAGILAMLQVQGSQAHPASPFITLPCAVAVTARAAWDPDAVKAAIGGSWTVQPHGKYNINHGSGLGKTSFVATDSLLVIANNDVLLSALLAGRVHPASPLNATYTAYFRHARERGNFGRIMTALDFSQSRGDQTPPFFSGNIASLSYALRRVSSEEIIERNTADRMEQQIVYRLAP